MKQFTAEPSPQFNPTSRFKHTPKTHVLNVQYFKYFTALVNIYTQLEEAGTHKSAKTRAGNAFCDSRP